MKTKGRRKSTNIEQQTPKQKKVAEFGLKLQKAAHANETLKEKTPIKDQGLSEEGKMFGALTNPGAMVPRMLQGNAPAIKDKVTKSPAERRGVKDPKPTHFSKKGDFPFLKHSVKDK
jgi:hypothetical protein